VQISKSVSTVCSKPPYIFSMSTIVEPSYCFETFHSMLSDERCVSSLRSSQVKRRMVWSVTRRMVPGTRVEYIQRQIVREGVASVWVCVKPVSGVRL
jgi:hypothetical protein